MKFRSCLTLFAAVSAPGSVFRVFHRALEAFFGGQPDAETVRLLAERG
jgi:uncharacterized protein (DUF1810 family)